MADTSSYNFAPRPIINILILNECIIKVLQVLDPKAAEPHYNLGVLYNREENTEWAKALYYCVEIDDSFPIAKDALKKLDGLNQITEWHSW